MSPIRFITIRADRLAAVVVISLVLLGLIGYLSFLGIGMRRATPVPRALLTLSIPASTAPTTPLPPAVVGQKAPAFSLTDTSGNVVDLASYLGKPVVLYFWATWCSFCREDLPELQRIHDSYKEQGLTILAINLLEKDTLVQSFAKQLKLKLPLLLDADGIVSTVYSVRATPTYMFIDKTGVLRAQIVGKPRPAVFERNLALILELPQSEVKITPPTETEQTPNAPSATGQVEDPSKTSQAPQPQQSPPQTTEHAH